MVTSEFSTRHPTDGVDEVAAIEIFKSVLVRIVGVGVTIEIVGRRILPTLFVTCILEPDQNTCNDELVKDLRGSLLR